MMTVRDVVCVLWQVYDNIDEQRVIYRVSSKLELESTDSHRKGKYPGQEQDKIKPQINTHCEQKSISN